MNFQTFVKIINKQINHDLKTFQTSYSTKTIAQANVFLYRNTHTGSLSKNLKILKFSDKVSLDNCLIISKSLHKTFLKILFDWFTVSHYLLNFIHITPDGPRLFNCSLPSYQNLSQYKCNTYLVFGIIYKINTKEPTLSYRNQATERLDY